MSSYLENGAFYTQSYYGTVIGNHMQAIEWCHAVSMTLSDPWLGFQGQGSLKGEYLQSDAFYIGAPARFQARVGKHLFDKIRREAPKKIFRLPTLVFSLPTLPYVAVAHPAHRSTLVPT